MSIAERGTVAPGAGLRTMRGVVVEADGGVRVRHDLPLPGDPGIGQVLVRILGVGLCGTDAALASGRRAVPTTPWLLGHEAVGEVRRVGPGVRGAAAGDLVVLEPNLPDLTCAACEAGHTSRCAHRRSSGVLTQPGFMTDMVLHPAEFVHRAPAGARIEDLVCVEPASVAAAAVRRSGITAGASAVVLGAGAQGLFAVQCLRAVGVRPLVTDIRPERVDLAVRHGAQPVPATGWQAAYVFDTTGAPAALAGVIDHIAVGGKVTVVGESSAPLGLTSLQLVQRQLTVVGSFIYDHPRDFAAVMDLIGQGAIRPGELLRPGASIDDAPALLADLQGRPGKPWLDLRSRG